MNRKQLLRKVNNDQFIEDANEYLESQKILTHDTTYRFTSDGADATVEGVKLGFTLGKGGGTFRVWKDGDKFKHEKVG